MNYDNPTPVCYRCEWLASDCKCSEGPLTEIPEDSQIEKTIRDLGELGERAKDTVIQSIKTSLIRWLSK